jgi:hypothetical protein
MITDMWEKNEGVTPQDTDIFIFFLGGAFLGVVFQHPFAPYRCDFGAFVPSWCNVVHCAFFVFLYWTILVSALLAATTNKANKIVTS